MCSMKKWALRVTFPGGSESDLSLKRSWYYRAGKCTANFLKGMMPFRNLLKFELRCHGEMRQSLSKVQSVVYWCMGFAISALVILHRQSKRYCCEELRRISPVEVDDGKIVFLHWSFTPFQFWSCLTRAFLLSFIITTGSCPRLCFHPLAFFSTDTTAEKALSLSARGASDL